MPDKIRGRTKGSANAASSTKRTAQRIYCVLALKEEQSKNHWRYIHFKKDEWGQIEAKAQKSDCDIATYVRIAVLGSNYRPPIGRELRLQLLALSRELTAQGRNIKKLVEQIKCDTSDAARAFNTLHLIRVPLLRTLSEVRKALVQGQPYP